MLCLRCFLYIPYMVAYVIIHIWCLWLSFLHLMVLFTDINFDGNFCFVITLCMMNDFFWMTHIKDICKNYQYLFVFYLLVQAFHNTPSEGKGGHLLITDRSMYFLWIFLRLEYSGLQLSRIGSSGFQLVLDDDNLLVGREGGSLVAALVFLGTVVEWFPHLPECLRKLTLHQTFIDSKYNRGQNQLRSWGLKSYLSREET